MGRMRERHSKKKSKAAFEEIVGQGLAGTSVKRERLSSCGEEADSYVSFRGKPSSNRGTIGEISKENGGASTQKLIPHDRS